MALAMQSLAFRRRPSAKSPGALLTHAPSDEDNNNDDSSPPPPPTTLMSLPPEIHLMISRYLIYPDALSLKHTCRHFYLAVDTGVRLKVDWLIERRGLNLDCPHDGKCDMGSDSKFCRGIVRLLMQRRREHMECECKPDIGCLVYGTPKCLHRRRGLGVRVRRVVRRWLRVEVWNLLFAVVAVLLGVLWVYGIPAWYNL